MKRNKRNKKLIAMLLCLTMLISIVPFGPSAAFGEESDGSISAEVSDGVTDGADSMDGAVTDESGSDDAVVDEAGADGEIDTDVPTEDGNEGDSTVDGDNNEADGDNTGDSTEGDGTDNETEGDNQPGEEIDENEVPKGDAPVIGEDEAQCICGAAEGEAHAEDCPLYVAPFQHIEGCEGEGCTLEDCQCDCHNADQQQCTCGAAEGEAHAEGCPLYVAPFQHIEGCEGESCTLEDCQCDCHKQVKSFAEMTVEELYDYLMALETEEAVEAFWAELSENLPEQYAALMEYYQARMEEEYLPAEPFTTVGPLLNVGRVINGLSDGALLLPIKSRMMQQILQTQAVVTQNNPAAVEAGGITLTKSSVAATDSAGNDIYKISLNAATESNVVVTSIPCDIVLVLDRSESMTAEKMSAMKTAVDTFLETVKDNSPQSRVAIVSYADKNGSTVDTGENQADESALVSISNVTESDNSIIVNPALTTAVTALPNAGSGDSYSDEGLQKATEILQSINETSENYENTRVVVLFSDGVPGKEAFDCTDTTGPYYNRNGEKITDYLIDTPEEYYKYRRGGTRKTGAASFRVVAQNSIYWTQILKGAKGDNIALAQQGFYEDYDKYCKAGGYFTDGLLDSHKGCGATMYCVGINLPEAAAKRSIGSAVNEYFYRASSHRLDGSHVGALGVETDWNQWNGQNEWEAEGGLASDKSQHDWNGAYLDLYTRNKGYYLVGSLADLNNIFRKIAQQTGEKLENVVVRDYISPYFDICDENGEKLNVNDKITHGGLTGTIKQDLNGVVYVEWDRIELNPGDVAGQGSKDFASEFYVKAKDGFLGGNAVPTNGENSGLYTTENATEPFVKFPQPSVDVKLADIQMTPTAKNVYLNGKVSADDLYNCMQLEINGEKITGNVTENNCGLEEWQTAYVNLNKIAKVNNNILAEGASSGNLTNDVNYTLTVTVTPKTGGTITEISEEGTATIKVFKPELTFKDSTVYYGDTAPNFNDNFVSEQIEWKHGEETAPEDMGTAPTVTVTGYTPVDNDAIRNNLVAVRDDFYVKVNGIKVNTDGTEQDFVNIVASDNQSAATYYTVAHQVCEQPCDFDATKGEFMLHVKTCELTITKSGADGIDENASFIFHVTGGNIPKELDVVVEGNGSVTIKGLPVGRYQVVEKEDWSWRYSAQNCGWINLGADADSDSATSTISNHRSATKWLDGYAYKDNHFAAVTRGGNQ